MSTFATGILFSACIGLACGLIASYCFLHGVKASPVLDWFFSLTFYGMVCCGTMLGCMAITALISKL